MFNFKAKSKKWAVLSLLFFCLGLGEVQAEIEVEPFTQTFLISAYYSPLPEQSFYYRGSFEADKRLNGNGTHGADGTPVYPGMIAAPKTYAFGTKIKIPGFGVGVVHDRGGAIVVAGERNHKYDRLDIWMGAGEEGLWRALAWGKREVTGTVYPAEHELAENFTLPKPKQFFTFTANLARGDSGKEVERLQQELKTYGYFRAKISGEFDELTEKALLGFQLTRKIFNSADETGAGSLEAQSRELLNTEIQRRRKTTFAKKLPPSFKQTAQAKRRTLSKGERGALVRDLQVKLTQAGFYEGEINGIFETQLEADLLHFQKQAKILASAQDYGAGVFGPATRTALAQFLAAQAKERQQQIQAILPLPGAAQFGMRDSVEVRKLQRALQELGLLALEPTGNFGVTTQTSLREFQLTKGIIQAETDFGAGFFGTRTRAALSEQLKTKRFPLAELPPNPVWQLRHSQETPYFERELAFQDTGTKVQELQTVLQQLGYLTTAATGEFGVQTQESLTKFQLAEGVIASAQDYGAGVCGPRTRAALHKTIEKNKITLKKLRVASTQ